MRNNSRTSTENSNSAQEQEQEQEQAHPQDQEQDQDQEQHQEEQDENRVKAYAKLEFPQHDFFIRKLCVIIGRRPPTTTTTTTTTTNTTNTTNTSLTTNNKSKKPTSSIPLPPSSSSSSPPPPSPSPPPSSSSSSSSSSPSSTHHPLHPTHPEQVVDVDLGPIRAVSRKHAALFYDWHSGCWSLQVLGRNGCVIDGRWKAQSEIIPLRARTKIQIAERIFHFMLPSSAKDSSSSSSLVSSHQSIQINRHSTHSTCSLTQSDLSSQPRTIQSTITTTTQSNLLSDLPTGLLLANSNPHSTDQDDSTGCESDCEFNQTIDPSPLPPQQPQPVHSEESQSESEESDDQGRNDCFIDDDHLPKSDDEPRPPSPPRHRGFNYDPSDLVDFNLMKSDSDSDSADEDERTSSSIEMASYPLLPGKAPASKAPKKTVATKGPTGRGKFAGKRLEARDGITTTDPDSEPHKRSGANSPRKTSAGSGGKGHEKGKQVSNRIDTALLPVKERRKVACITPPGAEIGTVTHKPPYTYASLITQALASQADEDGKMLVSEMCEWMAGVYPFYGAKEKDWQSAVRHNLNADKRFKRIERTPTDGGKGNFWTLKAEEWVHFDGLELRRPKEIKAVNVTKNDTQTSCSTAVTKEPAAGMVVVAPQRVAGAPSRSIGSVARSDIAAHHRATTTPPAPLPKSPTQSTSHNGIRPPPPTPAPQNDLPVFSETKNSKPSSILESYPIHCDGDDNFNVALPEEREPGQLPKLSSTTSNHSPVSLPTPAIDPYLLASSSSSKLFIPQSNPLPPPPTPPPPVPVLAATSSPASTTKKAITTTATTITKATAPKKEPKFEIIIQEPSRASSSSKLTSTIPKTQEELKRLLELEPPMYTNGQNQLILNKLIFNQLKPNQIKSLENLGANAAIKILQKFIIEYFKEKLAKSHNHSNNKKKNGISNSQESNSKTDDSHADKTASNGKTKAASSAAKEEVVVPADATNARITEPHNTDALPLIHPTPPSQPRSSHQDPANDQTPKRKLEENSHPVPINTAISHVHINHPVDDSFSHHQNKKFKI